MAIHKISKLSYQNNKNFKKLNFQNSVRLALQNKHIHCKIDRGDHQ